MLTKLCVFNFLLIFSFHSKNLLCFVEVSEQMKLKENLGITSDLTVDCEKMMLIEMYNIPFCLQELHFLKSSFVILNANRIEQEKKENR